MERYMEKSSSVKIFVPTKKYGVQTIIIDIEDIGKYQAGSWMIWGSARHHTLYVVHRNNNVKTVDGYGRFHRLIVSAPPHLVVDHINGNGLDNRKCNLRLTTQAGNNKNSSKRRNAKTSTYKGVHFDKRSSSWKTQIQKDGKRMAIGTFDTELEAVHAYNAAAEKYHGEYAKLNKIDEAG